MNIEIKDGPLGQKGGEPFPEVKFQLDGIQVVMENMKKQGALKKFLFKLIPMKVIARKLREGMGGETSDIAQNPLKTTKRSIPGKDGNQINIRIYQSEGENLPVMIYFHGGGWIGGTMDAVENICRGVADQTPCVAVNVEYRLAPENKFPAGLEDCYSSLLWVSEHITEYGGNPEKIALAGDSAGGNLALASVLLAKERKGPETVAQVLIYPAVDLAPEPGEGDPMSDDLFTRMYLPSLKMVEDPLVSPVHMKDYSVMPPTMLVMAEYCFLKEQNKAFGEKLAQAGVPVKAILYNGVNHAFLDNVGTWPYADGCVSDIAKYLKEVF